MNFYFEINAMIKYKGQKRVNSNHVRSTKEKVARNSTIYIAMSRVLLHTAILRIRNVSRCDMCLESPF